MIFFTEKFLPLFFFFFFYAFMGWCLEISYAAYAHKKFVNRGFLFGPYCPMYGVGCVLLIWILRPFSNNYILLFILSTVLTSTLEYVTGYTLEKIFKTKWWDYSMDPLNLHGRICLLYSIIWGFLSVLLIKFVHPFIAKLLNPFIYSTMGRIVIFTLLVLITIDLITTIKSLINFNNLIDQFQEFSKEFKQKIHNPKEDLNELSESSVDCECDNNNEEILIKEFKGKYENFLETIQKKYPRFLSVMPNYSGDKFKDHINNFKQKLADSKKNNKN